MPGVLPPKHRVSKMEAEGFHPKRARKEALMVAEISGRKGGEKVRC
jgi:hypothetical protein